MKQKFTLSNEQQQLVADNHDLIYSFLHLHNLPVDEWYDIAAIGICQAAYLYNTEKGKFTTYAYAAMWGEVLHALKRKKNLSAVPEEMISSLDVPVDDEMSNSYNIVDTIDSGWDTEDEIVAKIMYKNFYDKQFKSSKHLMDLFETGMSSEEVAQAHNTSKSNVNMTRKRLREKYKQFCCV